MEATTYKIREGLVHAERNEGMTVKRVEVGGGKFLLVKIGDWEVHPYKGAAYSVSHQDFGRAFEQIEYIAGTIDELKHQAWKWRNLTVVVGDSHSREMKILCTEEAVAKLEAALDGAASNGVIGISGYEPQWDACGQLVERRIVVNLCKVQALSSSCAPHNVFQALEPYSLESAAGQHEDKRPLVGDSSYTAASSRPTPKGSKVSDAANALGSVRTQGEQNYLNQCGDERPVKCACVKRGGIRVVNANCGIHGDDPDTMRCTTHISNGEGEDVSVCDELIVEGICKCGIRYRTVYDSNGARGWGLTEPITKLVEALADRHAVASGERHQRIEVIEQILIEHSHGVQTKFPLKVATTGLFDPKLWAKSAIEELINPDEEITHEGLKCELVTGAGALGGSIKCGETIVEGTCRCGTKYRLVDNWPGGGKGWAVTYPDWTKRPTKDDIDYPRRVIDDPNCSCKGGYDNDCLSHGEAATSDAIVDNPEAEVVPLDGKGPVKFITNGKPET